MVSRRAPRMERQSTERALGLLYQEGVGLPKDARKAKEVLQKAADQGISVAWHDPARASENGAGPLPQMRAVTRRKQRPQLINRRHRRIRQTIVLSAMLRRARRTTARRRATEFPTLSGPFLTACGRISAVTTRPIGMILPIPLIIVGRTMDRRPAAGSREIAAN